VACVCFVDVVPSRAAPSIPTTIDRIDLSSTNNNNNNNNNSEVTPRDEPKQCRRCGASLAAGVIKCGECGLPLPPRTPRPAHLITTSSSSSSSTSSPNDDDDDDDDDDEHEPKTRQRALSDSGIYQQTCYGCIMCVDVFVIGTFL
jgi:hypothetical protein